MDDEVQGKIRELADKYAIQLPNKIQIIAENWRTVQADHSKANINELLLNVHTLCGTAGTYGYQLISHLAGKIEQALREYQQERSQIKFKKVDQLIQELILAGKDLQHKLPTFEFDLAKKNKIKKIYILDKIGITKKEDFQTNYQISNFDNIQSLLQQIEKVKPDMLILNINLAKDLSSDVLKKFVQDLIIIIYTAEHDDFHGRLFTVRNNGQAFIAKPFETNKLLRMMENLFEARELRNERILIVDDSESLAQYYATLLTHHGMNTQIVSDATNFLVTLQEFQPDLILMDINMPLCSGTELAQIVQQEESSSSIPIIFVSTISERYKQLEVLSLAGDDFLTKPIDPKQLLSTIRSRLMRSRIVRTRMLRDGLTNLYNHTMIHQQLERELILAERYSQPVSVALIDIDFFKSINDTFGHQAGDKILKSLAFFLQNQLPKEVFIGRYGGEEFLIIMPKTSLADTVGIINNLLMKFSQMSHQLNGKEIFVKFSAGIAEYPTFKSSKTLVKAADDALYQAKNLGRNRVMHKP